jgi:hypothetical protein
MSVLLHHLVGLALGRQDESVARLSLPPRFADHGFTPERAAGDTPQSPPFHQPAQSVQFPVKPNVEVHSLSLAPPQQIRREAAIGQTPAATTQPIRAGEPAPRQTASVIAAPATLLPVKATPPSPQAMSVASRRADIVLPREAPAPFLQSLARPNTPPTLPRLQPLSQTALASVRQASNTLPPVIEVIIDRIDIRAPAAERPAVEAKRKPRGPSVALGDYLRGQGRSS